MYESKKTNIKIKYHKTTEVKKVLRLSLNVMNFLDLVKCNHIFENIIQIVKNQIFRLIFFNMSKTN